MQRLIQYALALCLTILVSLSISVFAQDDPAQDSPVQNNPAQDNPAQDNPVSVSASIFLVSTVDGEETFVETTEARPGQIIEYRLSATNTGDVSLPAGSVTVTGPVPEGVQYVPDSATPSSDEYVLEGSSDGQNFAEPDANDTQTNYSILQWTLLNDLEPEASVELSYRVTVSEE